MPRKMLKVAVLIMVAAGMAPAVLSAAGHPVAAGQQTNSDAQKYAGVWAGSYTNEGGVTNKVAYALKKDEKGQWGGTVKWVTQDGEQSADFKSLQIADGKMKGRIETPDGQVDVAIEGQFQGDNMEGTYAVIPKGSTEVVEKGTWKVTKDVAAKSPA
jgi:hypothetical protein